MKARRGSEAAAADDASPRDEMSGVGGAAEARRQQGEIEAIDPARAIDVDAQRVEDHPQKILRDELSGATGAAVAR